MTSVCNRKYFVWNINWWIKECGWGRCIYNFNWAEEHTEVINHPSKLWTFTQCCFNVGPPFSTLAQHWNSIEWILRRARALVQWPSCLLGKSEISCSNPFSFIRSTILPLASASSVVWPWERGWFIPRSGIQFQKQNVSSPLTRKDSILWVACSASDRQGSNFEFCVWRLVLSHSFHHTQEVLLAQFSLHMHKGGLRRRSFHFHFIYIPPVCWDIVNIAVYCRRKLKGGNCTIFKWTATVFFLCTTVIG